MLGFSQIITTISQQVTIAIIHWIGRLAKIMATDNHPDEVGAVAASPPSVKSKHELVDMDRQLSQKEASTPGAIKMMLLNIADLKNEVAELKPFRELFHGKDKYAGILEGKIKNSRGL